MKRKVQHRLAGGWNEHRETIMIGEICTFKIITVSLTSAEYLP